MDANPLRGATIAFDYKQGLYLESLCKLSTVKVDAVLAGHYQPCLHNGSWLLKKVYRTGLIKPRLQI